LEICAVELQTKSPKFIILSSYRVPTGDFYQFIKNLDDVFDVCWMITMHKGSQILILIETCYQLQPSDKELHMEHTPLRTIILH